jgi:hypothetical protein
MMGCAHRGTCCHPQAGDIHLGRATTLMDFAMLSQSPPKCHRSRRRALRPPSLSTACRVSVAAPPWIHSTEACATSVARALQRGGPRHHLLSCAGHRRSAGTLLAPTLLLLRSKSCTRLTDVELAVDCAIPRGNLGRITITKPLDLTGFFGEQ